MGKGGKSDSASSTRKYTLAQVHTHTQPHDCWIVIRGKVYDVSNWHDHPGGKVLLTQAGQDATDVFTCFHGVGAHVTSHALVQAGAAQPPAENAYKMLDRFYIGECVDADSAKANPMAKPAFEAEFRALIAKARTEGWYKSNKLYYAWKLVSTLGLLGLAAAICVYTESFAMKMVAALLLGLFWQQSGWLAHDFAHHQVFSYRPYNDYVLMLVVTMLGFSLDWWRNKHNTHHSVPNVHESVEEAHDGDPDIDTLPFLAWSRRFVRKVVNGPAKSATSWFMVSNQHFLFFPLLLFARMTWALQSLSYVFRLDVSYFGATDATAGVKREFLKPNAAAEAPAAAIKLRYEIGERVALIAHYVWLFSLLYFTMDFRTALVFFAVAQMSSGLLIALAFGVGHNGMALYDPEVRPGFAELQVTTTRNVDDSWYMGWFMGGLHYQVEHHLFPTMPRHNLAKIAPLVRDMCKRHNVPYRSTSLTTGTVEVLQHLRELALELQNGPM